MTVFNAFSNALTVFFTYTYKPELKLSTTNVALQTTDVTIPESIASYISHVVRLYRLNESLLFSYLPSERKTRHARVNNFKYYTRHAIIQTYKTPNELRLLQINRFKFHEQSRAYRRIAYSARNTVIYETLVFIFSSIEVEKVF